MATLPSESPYIGALAQLALEGRAREAELARQRGEAAARMWATVGQLGALLPAIQEARDQATGRALEQEARRMDLAEAERRRRALEQTSRAIQAAAEGRALSEVPDLTEPEAVQAYLGALRDQVQTAAAQLTLDKEQRAQALDLARRYADQLAQVPVDQRRRWIEENRDQILESLRTARLPLPPGVLEDPTDEALAAFRSAVYSRRELLEEEAAAAQLHAAQVQTLRDKGQIALSLLELVRQGLATTLGTADPQAPERVYQHARSFLLASGFSGAEADELVQTARGTFGTDRNAAFLASLLGPLGSSPAGLFTASMLSTAGRPPTPREYEEFLSGRQRPGVDARLGLLESFGALVGQLGQVAPAAKPADALDLVDQLGTLAGWSRVLAAIGGPEFDQRDAITRLARRQLLLARAALASPAAGQDERTVWYGVIRELGRLAPTLVQDDPELFRRAEEAAKPAPPASQPPAPSGPSAWQRLTGAAAALPGLAARAAGALGEVAKRAATTALLPPGAPGPSAADLGRAARAAGALPGLAERAATTAPLPPPDLRLPPGAPGPSAADLGRVVVPQRLTRADAERLLDSILAREPRFLERAGFLGREEAIREMMRRPARVQDLLRRLAGPTP